MERIDLRSLNNDELLIIRKQVVRLKRLKKTGEEIFELTGVTAEAASRIWSAYRRGGPAGIKPKGRGRRRGEQTLLSPEQAEEIRRIITDKTPEQLKLKFMLWTRQCVCELVTRRYGIKLKLRSASNYLKRWGFSCQRPAKKANRQDKAKVERFMKTEYPAIAKRAKKAKARIYWGDETGVNNQEYYSRGYAPKGRPPVVKINAQLEKINMVSAISNNGRVHFMVYKDSMNQQRLIEFMSRLIKDVKPKVFLILDNLKSHHGTIVQEWLKTNKKRIEVFYLPSYSPELNPDEYLNHALKMDVHSGIAPKNQKGIEEKTTAYMNGLQRSRKKVKAFFKHTDLDYINCEI